MHAVFRSLESAAKGAGASAITIGNFDGVHLGHRTLIRQTAHIARSHGWATGVLTFDPHPTAVVAPERRPKLICPLDERVRLLLQAGADWVFILPFTSIVAAMSAREFVEQILVKALNARAVIVGQGFRFGHKQVGGTNLLAQLGDEFSFETHFLAPITYRGEVVSSTVVRRHVAQGGVARAGRLLGRCFSVEGPIISGHGIGSKQTVPTLNLRPGEALLRPGNGVYITEVEDLADGRRWQGITNVGVRPTFGPENELTIETFLLSPFDGNNPERIKVSFRMWVRPELPFPDSQALRSQILRDVGRAEKYWRRLDRFRPARSRQ